MRRIGTPRFPRAAHDHDRQRKYRQREIRFLGCGGVAPNRIELSPQMPRHIDRRRAGNQGGERRAIGAQPLREDLANLAIKRFGALTRIGRERIGGERVEASVLRCSGPRIGKYARVGEGAEIRHSVGL